MTDDEINRCFESVMFDPNSEPTREAIGRAILAAHTAKLLAGVEMPEPHEYVWNPDGTYNIGQERCLSPNSGPCNGWEVYPIFTADQLRSYAAAAAAQARMKALDEAKVVCVERMSFWRLSDDRYDEAESCAYAVEKLKGRQA